MRVGNVIDNCNHKPHVLLGSSNSNLIGHLWTSCVKAPEKSWYETWSHGLAVKSKPPSLTRSLSCNQFLLVLNSRLELEPCWWNQKTKSECSKMAGTLIPGARVAVLSVMMLLCLTGNNIVPVAEAIWLTIPSSGTKCVSEEIQNNVVVLADYYVVDEAHPENPSTISARVSINPSLNS